MNENENFDVVIVPREVYDEMLANSIKFDMIRTNIRGKIDAGTHSLYGLIDDNIIMMITGCDEYLRDAMRNEVPAE